MNNESRFKESVKPLHLVLSVFSIALLVFGIVSAAKFGFSRLLTRYALVAGNMAAANEAIQLTPADADAHRARATLLSRLRLFEQAKDDLEVATRLRPKDDYLWLELGLAKDEVGDTQGAFASLDRAVSFSPYYAHTRWQRGNLLLRMGRYDEAFVDLRRAAEGNRSFLPNLIDLAWSLSREDANATAQWAQIDNSYERVLFTRFLARKGRGGDTLAQFQLAPEAFSEPIKKDLVRQLMDHHAYREAFEIWKMLTQARFDQLPMIYDGGFEAALPFDEVGFGWSVSRNQTKTTLSLDVGEHQSGAQSLRIVFSGESSPHVPIVSQTLRVDPQKRYQISFAAKTSDVVSGGLPYIDLKDPVSGSSLGRSQNLLDGSNEWRTATFEITTPPGAEAVVLSLERSACDSTPCPIFGVVWLDSFSIVESHR